MFTRISVRTTEAAAAVITPDGAAVTGGEGAAIATTVIVIPPSGLTGGGTARVIVGGGGFGPFRISLDGIVSFIGSAGHREPVRLRDILEALASEIVASGLYERHQVYIRHDDLGQSENPPSIDNYLEIVPLTETANQNTLTGGGEIGDMRTENIEFRMYHHFGVDQKNRQTDWTLDVIRGSAKKASDLHSLLQLLDIVDSSGNALLSEPMRVTVPTTFEFGNRGFGFVSIRGQFLYTSDLVLVL